MLAEELQGKTVLWEDSEELKMQIIDVILKMKKYHRGISANGEPIDEGRRYRVATSDYLSQGNDRMSALALGCDRDVRSDITIRDLMISYISKLHAEGRELSAVCDGRITIKE